MRLPQGFNMALNEPPPYDPLDPATPAGYGWMSQNQAVAPSTIYPHHANDLTGELVRMQRRGAPEANERDQLATLRIGQALPDAAELCVLQDIDPADVTRHFGGYKRLDDWIHYHVDISWLNTDAGIANNQVQIALPYEPDNDGAAIISATLSNMRASNVAGNFYELAIVAPTIASLYRSTGVGQTPVSIPLGLSGTDGGLARRLACTMHYRTNGVRAALWPLIEWYSLTVAPISSPEQTIIECRYDGTAGGETIELITWPGALMQDSFPAAAGRNRYQFTGMPAGDYRLRLGTLISDTTITVEA